MNVSFRPAKVSTLSARRVPDILSALADTEARRERHSNLVRANCSHVPALYHIQGTSLCIWGTVFELTPTASLTLLLSHTRIPDYRAAF